MLFLCVRNVVLEGNDGSMVSTVGATTFSAWSSCNGPASRRVDRHMLLFVSVPPSTGQHPSAFHTTILAALDPGLISGLR